MQVMMYLVMLADFDDGSGDTDISQLHKSFGHSRTYRCQHVLLVKLALTVLS